MKTNQRNLLLSVCSLLVIACGKGDNQPVANDMNLQFNNTFKDQTIVLGDAASTSATVHQSTKGQTHRFSELKYVISNIRLVKADGVEFPYHVANLDKGATVINHQKPQTLNYVLNNIPSGEYKAIKFGLGVKPELNTLDQVKSPNFYAEAGANDTQMMWEWGTGYRFTKIEGFYGPTNEKLSIHTGSTVEGTKDDASTYTQGVDAYRDITLVLPTYAVVGKKAPRIIIQADFDKLLSGQAHTIELGTGNATPNIHTAVNMTQFVNNLGGNGQDNITGMFSILRVEN